MNKQTLTLLGIIYIAILFLGGGAYFIYTMLSEEEYSEIENSSTKTPQKSKEDSNSNTLQKKEPQLPAPTFTIIGTVYRDNSPIAQAEILLYPLAPEKKAPLSLQSGSKGQFKFEKLKIGTYQLKASYGHQWTCLSDPIYLRSDSSQEIHLQTGSKLFGQVVDENRRPLEEVEISILAHQDSQVIPDAHLKSDVEGKFAFPLLPEGNYVLYFQKRGFCSQIVPNLNSMPNRIVQLFPGGTLRGKVLNKNDKLPIPKAHIEALNQNWLEHIVAEESGNFQIEGVPEGTFQLKVQAPGFLPQTLSIPIKKGEVITKDIELEAGFMLKGRVLDASSRNPIPSAKVIVLRESIVDLISDITEENGEFALEGLKGGYRVMVQVFKDGYTQSLEEQLKPIFVKTDRSSPTTIDILLFPSPKLKGIVRNSAGDSIGNAKISLTQNFASFRPAEYQNPSRSTSPSGEFEFSTILAGHGYKIQIEHPNYAAFTSEPFNITGNETVIETQYTLEEGSIIQGTIIGPQGEAVTDYEMKLFSSSANEGLVSEPATIKKGDNGAFTIGPLSATSKIVQIKSKGYALIQVDIPDPLTQSTLEIQLQKGERLAGRIEDRLGNPLSNVSVYTLYNNQRVLSKSDEDGSFELPDLLAGSYTLFAFKEGYDALQQQVEAPQENMELQLTRVVTLRGSVTGAGFPVKRFSVHYWGGDFPERSRDIYTEDGTFFLENVPDLPLEVEIRAMGFAPYYVGPLTPSQMGDLAIKLGRGLKVGGIVESEDGPVAGATILRGRQEDSFEGNTSEERAEVLGSTDENGAFLLRSFGSKSETITFLHPRYAPTYVQVTPPAQDLKIRMSGGGSLILIVKDGSGNGIPNIGIVVTGPSTRRIETGLDGTVTENRLFPGEYQVEVWNSSGNQYTVQVRSGEQTKLEITVR